MRKLPSIKSRLNLLIDRLSMSDNALFDAVAAEYGDKATYTDEKTHRYLFIDNDADILAVAHVDTADYRQYSRYNWGRATYNGYAYNDETRKWDDLLEKNTKHAPRVVGKWINSIRLDDRLGIHIILDLLPLLGVNCDVLLTDDEECAWSTAAYFIPTKKYNWGFSFDRHGVAECVMYQYSSDTTAKELIKLAGWTFATGSYSDISVLNIGATCFNFSAGYWHEHSDKCNCHYDQVMHIARLFAKFYRENRDTRLPFNFVPRKRYRRRSSYDIDYGTGGTVHAFGTGTKRTGTPPIGAMCSYCQAHPATAYDSDGLDAEPICDVCLDYFDSMAEDAQDEVDAHAEKALAPRDCDYCGMPIDDDNDDADFYGICVPCANWLRDNHRQDELEAIKSRLKTY